MFVRMTTISFWMDCRHLHFCTNDYHFFSKDFRHLHFCTDDYFSFWMDCRHVHFCRDDYLLILNGFSSCTFLYEWLPFLFECIVVIYISVRMTTISCWIDFCHVHFCTSDYHFVVYGFSSCTFCANDFPYSCIWIYVMHISVRMTTISFWMDFRHANFCTNDYHFFYMDFRHAYSVQWLSIFFWFSMMCAMLFNGWIAWSSDEL